MASQRSPATAAGLSRAATRPVSAIGRRERAPRGGPTRALQQVQLQRSRALAHANPGMEFDLPQSSIGNRESNRQSAIGNQNRQSSIVNRQ
jgi:hypothetical protein